MLADPPGPPLSPPPGGRAKPPRPRRRHARRGCVCLNCDSTIEPTNHYCPHCGQENIDVKVSLAEIFREATEEFIRFDSKLALTIVPLVTKPGRLTQEWAAGRRTKYLSPVRLYLTITAIFFLLVSYLYPHMGVKNAPPPSTAAVAPSGGASEKSALPRPVGSTTIAEDPREKSEPLPVVKVPNGKISGWLRGINKITDKLGAANDPAKQAELIDQFLSKLPTALFFMLPVYSVVLWILYVRSGRFYVEHLVFSLHCHAYYFMLLTLVALVPERPGSVPGMIVSVFVACAIPIYSYVALKRYYAQGWFKTFVKFLMLGYAYVVLLATAMFVSLVIAAVSLSS